jgi:hypothetical protein
MKSAGGGSSKKPPRNYPKPRKGTSRVAASRGIQTAHKALQSDSRRAANDTGLTIRRRARPHKTTGSRVLKGTRARDAAIKSGNVGRGARSTSQTVLTRRKAAGLSVDLNPVDAINRFLSNLGDTIRTNPLNKPDNLYDSIGNRIKNPTGR